MPSAKRIVVIGAGFGGLAIANRLQARGFQVTLLEKNPKVGGHGYPLEIDGYHFDMGPSLITEPALLEEIFTMAGKRLADYVDILPLDPYYRIYFHDNTFIDYTGDGDRMRSQMAQFNPRDAARYDNFIEASRGLYQAVIVDGLGTRPFMDWRSMLSFAPRALRLKAVLPSYHFTSLYFRDFRHRFIYSFHPLFIGGNPFRAPAVYQMIPYLEKIHGVLYSKGGMYSLVRALEKLFLEQGGTLHTSRPAQEILVRDGRATGVRTPEGEVPADIVISNADFIHTYRDLIRPEHRKKWSDRKLERVDYSMSAFLIYLGLNKRFPQLLHHTLVLSSRYRGLIRDIFDRKVVPEDFSLYLHTPTRTDDTMAPPGCESLYILAPVANLKGGQNWSELAEPFAQRILDHLEHHLGLTGLQESIAVKRLFTPEDFQRKQNAVYGSAWGVEPRLTQTAILRPHNRSEDVRGLYLVGASTHPGAGLPGVVLTAATTDYVIQRDLERG
ncbi:MAG TPA: phytoene desaturase family protein [bacterium]|nr:phytoene desaturase family protein [bacterium]HPG83493.1 phytoene desaturase family protein [bacterium]